MILVHYCNKSVPSGCSPHVALGPPILVEATASFPLLSLTFPLLSLTFPPDFLDFPPPFLDFSLSYQAKAELEVMNSLLTNFKITTKGKI